MSGAQNKAGTCPRCGGRGGYITDVTFTAKRVYGWDGEAIDTDGFTITSERNHRCQDCDMPVRASARAKAAGGAP